MTDETLGRAFSKYTTFVRAKVVRDKRTQKTKGYGFVSFRDPNDYVRAIREMNGKLKLSLSLLHTGKCIHRFAGIYAYCRYFIDRKW